MTEADLIAALRDCYDPVLHRDIVTLGLVQSATLSPDPEAPGTGIPGVPPRFVARVVLRPSSADETGIEALRAHIQNRLAGLPQLSRSQVEILPALFPIVSDRRS
ncbi:MAG TPA: hypothetical protein VM865_02850 [Acidobacteriaceae bacterium]|jgi:metal-sulfur cluster biosynthetic enzyme|nr:hypothetical protein [Acidobacteriaceae bacterium]